MGTIEFEPETLSSCHVYKWENQKASMLKQK